MASFFEKNGLTFVTCAPEDYKDVARIYNYYIKKGNATMDEVIHTADDIQKWVKAFNDRERLMVLKKENEVLGWAIIKKYSTRRGYRTTCETAVYLDEHHLGKGYGSEIKKTLIHICKELDYHHLVAKIWASNEGSIRYNEKLGYTIVGRQKEIGFKDGRWIDVIIMQYIIQ